MSSPKGTRFIVDLKKLDHNYHAIKKQLQPSTLFMAVVKANAYGHGAVPVAQRLQDLGTDYFAVAYTQEGVELRDHGITTPILILHPQVHELETCIDRCLEPVLYSVKMIENFYAFAKAKNQKSYPVHIEFNTGMNRIGLDAFELSKALELLHNQNVIKVRGVQSHLASSEDLDEAVFTQSQIDQFTDLADRLESSLDYPIIKHECNTSAVFNNKTAHFNMVRAGIGLYGYGGNDHSNHLLEPISTLVSNISLTRWIEDGDTVSYNRTFTATKKMRYAVIPLGHADGVARIYGHSKLSVYINNKPATTLGIICMDMFMVDITTIDCEAGDEVIIMDANHRADTLAHHAGSNAYEFLTGIRPRVPRVYSRS